MTEVATHLWLTEVKLHFQEQNRKSEFIILVIFYNDLAPTEDRNIENQRFVVTEMFINMKFA